MHASPIRYVPDCITSAYLIGLGPLYRQQTLLCVCPTASGYGFATTDYPHVIIYYPFHLYICEWQPAPEAIHRAVCSQSLGPVLCTVCSLVKC